MKFSVLLAIFHYGFAEGSGKEISRIGRQNTQIAENSNFYADSSTDAYTSSYSNNLSIDFNQEQSENNQEESILDELDLEPCAEELEELPAITAPSVVQEVFQQRKLFKILTEKMRKIILFICWSLYADNFHLTILF